MDLHKSNLMGANLFGVNLFGADLTEANLSGADLRKSGLQRTKLAYADLSKAKILWADLEYACLYKADLMKADLSGANLSSANLTEAYLVESDLSNAHLVDTILEKANLRDSRIHGISVWRVNLKGTNQKGLIITPDGEPVISVDNLEVAQFIYLLLNNETIRHTIDTITSKVVLILGRFSPERKSSAGCNQRRTSKARLSARFIRFREAGHP